MNKILFLILVLIFHFKQTHAKVCTSIENGNWSDAGTWSCNLGGVPACGDTIVISSGTTITVNNQVDFSEVGCPPTTIIVDGTLNFNTGKRIKLTDDSNFIINDGGSINPGGGGGNSNLIEIGGVSIWTAGDGSVSGPWMYDNSTLPILLSSFYFNLVDNKVNFFWTTESEINNEFFYLERSRDGKEWHSITVLEGANNSNSVINYSYTDQNPLNGQSFYRLRQTDFDGKYSYSKVLVVKIEKVSVPSFYPNPSSGEITLMDFKEFKRVKILDLKGRILLELDLSKNPKYNIEKLYNGVYLIQFESKTSIFIEKLIIQK